MSKKFNVNDIVTERQNELDSSPLFQRKAPAPSPVRRAPPQHAAPETVPAPLPEAVHIPPAALPDSPIEPAMPDGRHDVTASARQDVNYRAWKEIIENTETKNSALRLTSGERYEIEDLVSELERTHHIKTSMNELARLGLLSLLHDYQHNATESLVYKVKKS